MDRLPWLHLLPCHHRQRRQFSATNAMTTLEAMRGLSRICFGHRNSAAIVPALLALLRVAIPCSARTPCLSLTTLAITLLLCPAAYSDDVHRLRGRKSKPVIKIRRSTAQALPTLKTESFPLRDQVRCGSMVRPRLLIHCELQLPGESSVSQSRNNSKDK